MTSSESSHSDNGQQRIVTSSTGRPARGTVRRRSYADWISRAIQSSPLAKMTLANIYNWMATNVPGLYEKRNLHSSKGWKNAVRHTLSVNRLFQKSSQPNSRAALWSIAPPDSESSESPSPQPPDTSSIATSSSSSTIFIPMTTCTTMSSIQSSSSSMHSSLDQSKHILTQRLEVHHQDGTVRTVTVPKPFPIHVVGDYRLVTLDRSQHIPQVSTSRS